MGFLMDFVILMKPHPYNLFKPFVLYLGCEEAIPFLKNVTHVVISDKGYQHETQKTIPLYSQIAKGGPFGGETRKVLTTRKDGRIAFNFSPNSWGPDSEHGVILVNAGWLF
jgi:hypothetical protein